ncbi:RDD family protein [Mucilaginibacter sp. AW1-7]|jgi:uncharacterized RDD family membrane protein YckC|uniref:RDD family protein n=1 Tax=unclassified Mucilaginibacter TaxID=2617802 RepID=UPI00236630DB|nr:RDD family protein [Mucilaginibacter sp. KACC 22773]WDF79171.1 RDD family protein [Mucilaginibacter sp. KACC 22773]
MKVTTVIPRAYIKLRIFATLIDYSIYGIFYFGYIYAFDESTRPGNMTVTGLMALPIFLVWFLYFVVIEALNGTPGHDICKLKVVTSGGAKITIIDALKRRICDPIDIMMYGIPAIICISKTEKHQRIGDLLANTLVVKASDITVTEVIF